MFMEWFCINLGPVTCLLLSQLNFAQVKYSKNLTSFYEFYSAKCRIRRIRRFREFAAFRRIRNLANSANFGLGKFGTLQTGCACMQGVAAPVMHRWRVSKAVRTSWQAGCTCMHAASCACMHAGSSCSSNGSLACEQGCEDLLTGFQCVCRTGFALNTTDNRTCVGMALDPSLSFR